MLFEKNYLNIFIIILIILAVYYPVNHYGTINLDDKEMIFRANSYTNFEQIKTSFHPKKAGNYYRPLLETISYIDSKIWGFQAAGYHLTNLIFHLLNALVLYFISLKLFKKKIYAMAASILFALHPLNTESVVWISGRSDVFATFFSLLAYLFYLYRNSLKYLGIFFSILAGLLCKESAFAVFPIIIFSELWNISKYNYKATIVSVFKLSIFLFIPLTIYLSLRSGGNATLYSSASWPSNNDSINSFPRIITAFSAIGFYLKKLFIPWPLNFGIMKINNLLYMILSILFICFNLFLVYIKQYKYVIACISIVCSFAPALIISTGEIAWSPYAERYLYLSVCLWSLGIVYLTEKLKNKHTNLSITKYIIIICLFTISTFFRVLEWKDDHILFTKALKYSPENGKLLYKSGESCSNETLEIQYYEKAISVSKKKDLVDYSYLALAYYEMKNKNNKKVFEYLNEVLKISKSYSHYIDAAGIVLKLKTNNNYELDNNIKLALKYYELAHSKNKSAFVLYKIGKLNMRLGRDIEALSNFNEIINRYPESSYANYSSIIINRKEKKKVE